MTELKPSAIRDAPAVLLSLVALLGLHSAGAGPFPPARRAQAGEFHGGNALTCSDCHTIHYSENALPPTRAEAGGPWGRLLRYSNVNELCLSCHDGNEPKSPDVLAPVTQYVGSGDEHSGAGFFSGGDGSVSANGHDLGGAGSSVPLSTMGPVQLSCASCHDPHGNANYRNLRPDPGTGGGRDILLGTDVFENVSPPVPPTQSGVVQAYRRSNIGYRSGMVQWCMQCHDLALTGGQTLGTSHPNEAAMSGFLADAAHWLAGTGTGFGTATNDGVEGVPRLRFQEPGGSSYATSTAVAATNQVFCLSCHHSHGGPYEYGMIWPSNSPGNADQDSGCQQCHNM